METLPGRSHAQYALPTTNGEQRPSRVDPSYPLPSSLPPSQDSDRSPMTNGMARTTSRKRRPSGSGTGKPVVDHFPQPPAAPEVPKAPPVSYRPPPNGENYNRQENGYSGSFAQRAAVLTGRSIPQVSVNLESDPSPEPPKRERLASLNRPIGGLYSEIQQQKRDSFPSNSDPASPRRTSIPTSPQYFQARGTNPATRIEIPTDSGIPTSPPVQSSPRRTSAGGVELQRKEWAHDRSPLQKLESKLSDISKEEKRARVQKAEERLRDSRPGIRIEPQQRTRPLDRTAPRRASAGTEPPNTTRIPDRTTQQRDSSAGQVRHETLPTPPRNSTVDNKKYKQRPDRQLRPAETASAQREVSGDTLVGSANPLSQGRSRETSGRSTEPPRGEPPPERGVRFQAEDDTEDESEDMGAIKGVSPSHRDLYQNKAESSRTGTSAATFGGAPDHVPGHAVPGRGQSSKYEVPPQTASGIRARQRVGFSSGPQENTEIPAQRRHHLSDILHHHHSSPVHDHESRGARPKTLEEWRQGGTARLAAADFVDEPDDAWWDKNGSSSRRRSQRASGGVGSEALQTFTDSNGKHQPSPLTAAMRDSRRNGSTPDPAPKLHTRPYIASHEPSQGKKTVLTRLEGHLSSSAREAYHMRKDPNTHLSSAYSYSCTDLADHTPENETHICEPYLSTELTKSMRSIRIRPVPSITSFSPPLYLKCGPLLRYTGMKRDRLQTKTRTGASSSERETWRGSVMIVTTDADSHYDPAPTLRLFPEPMEILPPPPPPKADPEEGQENLPDHYIDPVAGLPKLSRTGTTIYVKPVDDLEHSKDLSRVENDDGLFEAFRTAAVPTAYGTPDYRHGQNGPQSRNSQAGRKGVAKPKRGHRVRGIRLHAERGVTFWRFNFEVELGTQENRIAYSINNGPALGFWVPARGQTMNMMFHSCNGFSMSVDPNDFSGPDPLWRDVLNAHQTRPFHVMIGGGDQIYNDAIMNQSPLFREWLAIKDPHQKHSADFSPSMQDEMETFYLERYAMWFSQGFFGMANSQIPMVNVWDDHDIIDGYGSYPHHFMSTPVFCGVGAVAFKYYMLFQHQSVPTETSADEPSWLLGAAPGPYISELSRSVFLSLGKNIAFLGLDCRTERMREEILSEASYDLVFDRCRREIIEGETKHLIVLLGVPIAYPRLVWLENLLTSRVMDPIKALGRAGMLGGFLNKFDGGVEILDDLDDHWTAKNHKQERNWFVQELQELAAEKSVRVTILGGDVHLAAVGQFYSNPKLGIPKDRDHRYMANIVSSAIVNTPPPEMMGDILNKRNKIHHLDHETDENMIPMFSHDVDGKARNNKRLLPRRNWCSIREYWPGATPPPTPPESEPGTPSDATPPRPNPLKRTLSLTRNDVKPGNLFRRLSGRNPISNEHMPSNGYEDDTPADSPTRDEYFPRHPGVSPPTTSSANATNTRTLQRHGSAPLQRPGNFLRRPTNMSERAATRGDDEDAADHLNLENGLDIVLNCEVDQKDPAGITAPYRLLIPALLYEGEGDENTTPLRKKSVLSRLGSFRGRRNSSVAGGQGQGNWGKEEDSLNGTAEEEADREEQARPRRWSFGLTQRRQYRDQSPLSQREFADRPPERPQQLDGEASQDYSPFHERPQQQRQFEDRNQQIGQPNQQTRRFSMPARQARRFEPLDDYEDTPGRDSNQDRDSIDYHEHLDSSRGQQGNGYPGRRPSKADRMLGVANRMGVGGRGSSFANSEGMPNANGNGQMHPVLEDEYSDGDDGAYTPDPPGGGAKRMSLGYGGIEAYSEKKGWREGMKRWFS